MPDDRQSGLLRDMLDSAILIRTYLVAVDRKAFLADSEKQDAVLRRFEIMGEAASRLAPEVQAFFPAFPSGPCAACATSSCTTMGRWTLI